MVAHVFGSEVRRQSRPTTSSHHDQERVVEQTNRPYCCDGRRVPAATGALTRAQTLVNSLSPQQRQLCIAMIATPWFQLPPRGYGGIEWMCFWLVEELVKQGHEVTLVAAGKNQTHARFLQTYASPPTEQLGDSIPEIVHAGAASRLLHGLNLDVVHDHSFAGPLLARGRQCPTVVTAHGPVNGQLAAYYREISTATSLVSISSAQRAQAPDLPWVATIHNAVPTTEYPFRRQKDDFALWLGRMSPEKAPHVAIDVAREAGWSLVLAGKCNEAAEKAFFDSEVRPRLGRDAIWVGEAETDCKKELLSKASALLFPIQWPEPFGIVMVEAMACGTPVVALRQGSVPEVVLDGVTGYVCDTLTHLPAALRKSERLRPEECRKHAVTYFDVSTMVARYEDVYRSLIDGTTSPVEDIRVDQAHTAVDITDVVTS
jgi:glycosyltransferase involved in cell wall biosynthesis